MKFANDTLAARWAATEHQLQSIYKAWQEMPLQPKRGSEEFANFEREMEAKIRKPSKLIHHQRIAICIENNKLLASLKIKN